MAKHTTFVDSANARLVAALKELKEQGEVKDIHGRGDEGVLTIEFMSEHSENVREEIKRHS